MFKWKLQYNDYHDLLLAKGEQYLHHKEQTR